MSITELETETPSLAEPEQRLDGKALDGLRILEALAANAAPELEHPRHVPFSELETLPVFTNREQPNERLIADLVKVLASGDTLPAITVLRVGGRTFVIDGHQRLEAFRAHASKAGRGTRFRVPVAYFVGTPAEAVFASIATNSRHGVRLSASERTDAAWKLVLIGEKTRTEIITATGVSRSWVTQMRKVKRTLGEEAAEFRRWHHALQTANGRGREELSDEEYEDRKRMKAERIADQITRAIGQHSDDPELMAMAMEAVLGRNVLPFIQHLTELQREALEEAGMVREDAEF